jgi:hypothetical protein
MIQDANNNARTTDIYMLMGTAVSLLPSKVAWDGQVDLEQEIIVLRSCWERISSVYVTIVAALLFEYWYLGFLNASQADPVEIDAVQKYSYQMSCIANTA